MKGYIDKTLYTDKVKRCLLHNHMPRIKSIFTIGKQKISSVPENFLANTCVAMTDGNEFKKCFLRYFSTNELLYKNEMDIKIIILV